MSFQVLAVNHAGSGRRNVQLNGDNRSNKKLAQAWMKVCSLKMTLNGTGREHSYVSLQVSSGCAYHHIPLPTSTTDPINRTSAIVFSLPSCTFLQILWSRRYWTSLAFSSLPPEPHFYPHPRRNQKAIQHMSKQDLRLGKCRHISLVNLPHLWDPWRLLPHMVKGCGCLLTTVGYNKDARLQSCSSCIATKGWIGLVIVKPLNENG